MSIPKMSIPKMPIPIMSTVPKCLFIVSLEQAIGAYEPRHEISNNVVCAASKASDQSAHMGSLITAFSSCLNIL